MIQAMAHLDTVKQHLEVAAAHHRKSHQEALREAAVARAERDAQNPPAAPQTGLQAPDEGFWVIGGED